MEFLKENRNKDSEPLQKEVLIKEEASIDVWNVRIGAARTLLSKGCDVKVCIRPKGRNLKNVENIKGKILEFSEELSDISVIKKYPEIDGKNITMVLQFIN